MRCAKQGWILDIWIKKKAGLDAFSHGDFGGMGEARVCACGGLREAVACEDGIVFGTFDTGLEAECCLAEGLGEV